MNKRLLKKALSISLTGAMAVTAFSCTGSMMLNADAADSDYGLVENIQDSTILHCFDWKYKDIIADMENIAKAGFSAIQTSPVQPSEGVGAWYWLYQPTGFTVGTNELGTPEELQELCEAAHSYGIKVVVDVVANHLAGNHENIQEDLQPDEYWHTEGEVTNYGDRYQVTHGKIGMDDINSENEYVQEVVADYVKALKNIGVDGIRWDAAKHIGLPSEGCDFWSAVTQEGLYNYGEILKAPCDKDSKAEDKAVNNALMKEYTDYMSVTDSSYATDLVNEFKKGKAPATDGNWLNRGIDKDKLVYWGESHDTYSNGEGLDTNGVAQNIIDRAYAVAAAQNDAAALYLSRPFATARDSIRIGVKGSTHYMAPEIAAVNHFHNAMVGKADAYAASNGCAVVTRENGGAVIVCGEGSGAVSVENVNGYVPAGTYKDEVTGNEFTVTDTTITGTVGESGIAVVYDSDFVSKVYCDTDSDTSFTGKMTVKVHAVDMETATFSVTDGEHAWGGNFYDGDEIVIGEEYNDIGANLNDNSTVTFTLMGTGNNGKEVSVTYTYYKLASRKLPEITDGGIIYDNTGTNWTDVNIYVYDESGATTITNSTWPGVKMTKEADNYFSYQLPEQFAECKHIMVIFNNNGKDQIPGAMQSGLTMAYTDQKLYDGTKWVHLAGDTQPEEPVEATKYGIVGSMTGWGSSADFPMYETESGIYVGKTKELAAGDYQFKVRADGTWDENYGVYEPDYDRTFDSQTNLEAHLDENGYIYVKLDTTTDDEITWGVSYAVVYGEGEPEWIFTGKPQDEEPEPVLSDYVAVIKSADGEPIEIFLYEDSNGYNGYGYHGKTDVLPAGTYEIKIFNINSPEDFYGEYYITTETNINTTPGVIELKEPAAIYVELTPEELFPGLYIGYAIAENDGTYTNYTRSAPPPFYPPEQDSSEPAVSSEPENPTDTQPSQTSQASQTTQPSQTSTQTSQTSQVSQTSTTNNNTVNTGDTVPFMAVMLGLVSAVAVFFTSRKKSEE